MTRKMSQYSTCGNRLATIMRCIVVHKARWVLGCFYSSFRFQAPERFINVDKTLLLKSKNLTSFNMHVSSFLVAFLAAMAAAQVTQISDGQVQASSAVSKKTSTGTTVKTSAVTVRYLRQI
jgi:hypothetical protein